MGSLGRRLWRGVTTAIAVSLALDAGAAVAATIRVTTTSDELKLGDHACSLREAIAAVNSPASRTDCAPAAFGANTIVLGAHHYALKNKGAGAGNSSGDLNVVGSVNSLTIRGAGEGATVIDATGLGDRVLQIANGPTVRLDALTITGGHAPDGTPGSAGADSAGTGGDGGSGGGGANGGGIDNQGTLTLQAVAVIGNHAGNGGAGGKGGEGQSPGAAGDAGAGGQGGGIYSEGTLRVSDSTIAGNHAGNGGAGGTGGLAEIVNGAAGGIGGPGGSGGGVLNDFGSLTIVRSTISANAAGAGGRGGDGGVSQSDGGQGGAGGHGGDGGNAGAIESISSGGSLINSTVAANLAGKGGDGGIGGQEQNHGGGGNGGDGGAGGSVGGIYGFGGAVSLADATIVGNAPGGAGAGGGGGTGSSPGGPGGSGSLGAAGTYGGIFSTATLRNTLVAYNSGGNCAGSTSDGGHNLSFPDATCPGINADPRLGPLQHHGGLAKTIALEPGSAAINKIPASGAGCPSTDERGVRRPQGAACDIGAFEFARPNIAITTPRAGAHYPKGSRVLAKYSCSEGAIPTTIASCIGTVRSGQPINTSTRGTDRFTVTATDRSGNRVTKTVSYTVT